MVAFEIKINGRKRCVAGLNEAGNLVASLWWTKQTGARQKSWLNVGAVTGERGESDRVLLWVDEKSMRVGDKLSIRIVQTQTADPPTMIGETKRSSKVHESERRKASAVGTRKLADRTGVSAKAQSSRL